MKATIAKSDVSNITFNRVELREAVFRDGDPDTGHEWREEDVNRLNLNLEVLLEIPSGPDEIRVLLHTRLTPPSDLVCFEQLSVTLVGHFGITGPDQDDVLKAFALAQAPLLIWPYVRQAITTLTSQTRFGGLILPPINLQGVIRAMSQRAGEVAGTEG